MVVLSEEVVGGLAKVLNIRYVECKFDRIRKNVAKERGECWESSGENKREWYIRTFQDGGTG